MARKFLVLHKLPNTDTKKSKKTSLFPRLIDEYSHTRENVTYFIELTEKSKGYFCVFETSSQSGSSSGYFDTEKVAMKQFKRSKRFLKNDIAYQEIQDTKQRMYDLVAKNRDRNKLNSLDAIVSSKKKKKAKKPKKISKKR